MNRKYLQHKHGAAARGIEFKFTEIEWIAWWECQLGSEWPKLRGRKRGQYVMARIGDKGAYEPSNVQCLPCSLNHAARTRLPEALVRTIRQDVGSCRQLARKHGVSVYTISTIRSGKSHMHII